MNINNVYLGMLFVVACRNSYDHYSVYTKAVKPVLLYHKSNKCYIDMDGKVKYSCNIDALEIGQMFVDLENYRLIPFSELLYFLEKGNNVSIKMKTNSSRRKILKVLKNYILTEEFVNNNLFFKKQKIKIFEKR